MDKKQEAFKKFEAKLDKYGVKRYVDKDKGTVTLKYDILTSDNEFLIRDISLLLGYSNTLYTNCCVYSKYFDLNKNRFVATAKCRADDTFSLEIGTKIAYVKLRRKIKRNLIQILLAVHKDTERALDKVHDLIIEDKLDTFKDFSGDSYDKILEKYQDLNWED